jgi:hypothetical protein
MRRDPPGTPQGPIRQSAGRTVPEHDPDVELEAALTLNRFLIEMAFTVICQIHPEGQQAAFRTIESSLLDMLKRTVANPFPKNARDVQISDEVERQLRQFLASLADRMRS